MIKLQDLTRRKLERQANAAIVRATDLDRADVGKGAIIRLFHLSDQSAGMSGLTELWFSWIGGRANEDRRSKYEVFSFEKALRTALNYQQLGHVSSFESVRRDAYQYQGAALVECMVPELNQSGLSTLIVSVSGLAALNDQRTGLLTLELMDWKAEKSITRVLATTDDRGYLAFRGESTEDAARTAYRT